jgi:hypothetical protein
MSNQRDGWAIDVRVAETMHIEVPGPDGMERVAITLEHKSGQRARLRVRAKEGVRIKPPKMDREPVPG